MPRLDPKWREASRWPQTIYLAGVCGDTGLPDASMHLRQTVTDALRDGKAWADPQLISKRNARAGPARARQTSHACGR